MAMTRLAAAADFELQELRILLDAVSKAGIKTRDMKPLQRAEMENYARQVVQERGSVPIRSDLPGTQWKLVFSTEESTNALPKDATVLLKFEEDSMEYVLQFSEKTFGLDRLTAQCQWVYNDGPVDQGAVTYVYEKITTDAFGFSGVGLGGLLQGRGNCIFSAYYDGKLWIDRGMGSDGEDYFNVYVRQDVIQ